MPLVILPFIFRLSLFSPQDSLKVMRFLNAGWKQLLVENDSRNSIKLLEILVSFKSRIVVRSFFAIWNMCAYAKSFSKRSLFLVKPQSDEINCEMFYLSAGYWTASRRHYNRFYRASFSYKHFFSVTKKKTKKKSPEAIVTSHALRLFTRSLHCHQRIGLAARVLKMKSVC